jgi:hypothetical protein
MTSKQNGGMGGTNYGFGWSVSDSGFGHGGAFKNSMEINTAKGWILIFMVQQAGPWGTADGDTIGPTLARFADELTVNSTNIPKSSDTSDRH